MTPNIETKINNYIGHFTDSINESYERQEFLMNYVINNLCKYIRIFYLIILLSYEVILYNTKNCIYYLINKEPEPRLYLIKNVVSKLEKINIVYVKIFQGLCINKNILNNEEKDYLIKYTDNVPYDNTDIDYNTLNKICDEYNITLNSSNVVNSGIIGLVFKGTMNTNNESKKVVIKMLKNNIENRLKDVYNQSELFINICSYLPYLKNMNLSIILEDNKSIILNQLNFKDEAKNIKFFETKFKNIDEFVIPHVYDEITNKYKSVIVMEDITGLKFSDIEIMDESIKENFCNIILKFGYMCCLYFRASHCDLHSGNIFFYINNIEQNNKPKLQIGIIDFGIINYISKIEQNHLYNYYNATFNKEFISFMEKNLKHFLRNKEDYENLNIDLKDYINDKCEIIMKNADKLTDKVESIGYIYEIAELLNKYNLIFNNEFNQAILSLSISIGLCISLCKDIKSNLKKVLDELNYTNKLLEIDDEEETEN